MTDRALKSLRVPVKQLRRECSPAVFKFRTTADLPPIEGTVGQDRAVTAMDFGLSIEADGYNLYVAGPSGTGRSTELRAQLAKIAAERPAPRDWCYVFNFRDPARPEAISLPPGRARPFSQDVEGMVAAVRREIPKALESDEYAQRREQINRELQAQRERLFETLRAEAQTRGLAVNATPMGITTVPVVDGKPITPEQYELLTDDRKREIQQQSAEVESIIASMAPQLRRLDRGAAELLAQLDKQLMRLIALPLLEEVKREYVNEVPVSAFIDRLGADMVEHVDDFRGSDQAAQIPAAVMAAAAQRDGVFDRYKVNVIVSHDGVMIAPVVFEESPSYYHMFGRVDYRPSLGSVVTDHTMIKPGALHRANGGFLVVDALDALSQPLVWETLKRALRTGQARIENLGEQLAVLPTSTLTPEPIPISVKIAMIGSSRLYQLLQNADDDFKKLFKAKADFTTDVERIPANVELYARFIARQAREKGMRPFDRDAVARVIEFSSRMVSDQNKLSLHMMDVVDLLVEADYWACEENSAEVSEAHVEKAIDQQVYRSNLIEERIQEFIDNGTIKVDVSGAIAGQVNGLSVYDLGDYSFGRPSRITARVSLGRGQVVNLEREIQKSGPSHSKGFLIITGYLNGKFAHRQPLSFAASLTFEQVYDEVDGDSASSTELYALLSAITDVPLKQNLAVTGSVNQLGEIQAIGGVNEKVEGFYAVCKARGLTGDQGVIIPADNVHNLMLKPEVVRAIRDERFHVYAVSSIEQGIELLTGMPAGKLKKNDTYSEGTFFRRVTDCLEAMTRRSIEVNRAAQKELVAPATPAASSNGRRKRADTRRPGER
jgi:predicted ATP-dependent protease